MLLQSTAPPTELSTGYLTSSYVMTIYVYRPKLGDFYKLFMCWVVGLDCFTATGLYILPRFPLLIYIQILVSAIHTINDNVNNRSFIQAGFEPAIYSYLFYAFTVHRSTNWAIDRLSFCMLRSKDIYIPLLIESRATSCHAIAAMPRLIGICKTMAGP